MATAIKWTEEKLRAEMVKHAGRWEFAKANPGANSAAKSRFPGLIQEVFPEKKSNIKWTTVKLRAALSECKSKAEFRKRFGDGAMKRATELGLHEEYFGKDKRVFLTDEEVLNIGRQFKTANDFKRGAYNVYQVAGRRKLMGNFNFTQQKETWTDEKVRTVAAQYTTYSDFIEGDHAAYQAAAIRGILHDLGLVTRTGYRAGLADVVYVWRVVGKVFNGNPVYKIGLTSSNQGDTRIKRVAREAGFEFEILFFENVGEGNAYRVERMLKRIGEHPGYEGIDGATEFRALSNQQLEVVLEILINNVQT